MHAKYGKALGAASLLPMLSFAGLMWAGPSAAVEAVYLPAGQVQAYKRPAGAPAPAASTSDTPHAEVLFNNTVGTGKEGGAEMHKALDVLYVATGGRADVVAGGVLESESGGPPTIQTGGGEDLRGKIVGGHTYSMSPGDILWMPAGTPHQVNVPKDGSFHVIVFRGMGLTMPAGAGLYPAPGH